MEVDRRLKVLLVPETPRCVLHTLDLCVDRLARCVRDAMGEVRQDVRKPPLQHPSHLDDWLQAAVRRPVVPPTEVILGGTLVDVVKQRHRRFLQRPRARRLETALPQRLELLPCGICEIPRVPQPEVLRPDQPVITNLCQCLPLLAANAVNGISQVAREVELVEY